jgi:hypothetical protein
VFKFVDNLELNDISVHFVTGRGIFIYKTCALIVQEMYYRVEARNISENSLLIYIYI